MEITAAQVKALRDATGAGMMDCRNALREAGGDLEQATKLLREAGKAGVEKRAGRSATQGVVDSYLHTPDPNLPPKLGVLVELDCETDFVAKTDGTGQAEDPAAAGSEATSNTEGEGATQDAAEVAADPGNETREPRA